MKYVCDYSKKPESQIKNLLNICFWEINWSNRQNPRVYNIDEVNEESLEIYVEVFSFILMGKV